jgi:hypothetical protein
MASLKQTICTESYKNTKKSTVVKLLMTLWSSTNARNMYIIQQTKEHNTTDIIMIA